MKFLLATCTLFALLAVRAAADSDNDDLIVKWYDKPEVEGSYSAPPGMGPGSYTGSRVGEGEGEGNGDEGHGEPDGRLSGSDGKYWKPVTQVLWGQCSFF